MFEKILRWFDQIHGLTFVALRYFNVAGASERFGEAPPDRNALNSTGPASRLGRSPHAEIYGADFPISGRDLYPGLRPCS